MTVIHAGDVRLGVVDEGSGEPVVLIQTALTADELVPVALRLRDRFRTILYHRRGYGNSDPVAGPGSIRRDAADCGALLDALGIGRVHIVGLSYSAAVALQLAADSAELVHSLTLVEPPPVHVASAPEFRAANERLFAARRDHGPDVALEGFLTLVIGENWRTDMERNVPGSIEQTRRDARTFLDTDLPALLAWRFSAPEARRIGCPVLYVGGTESGPWFAEVRSLMLDWFPGADELIVDGADHSLALTHADSVGAGILAFLQRHPMR